MKSNKYGNLKSLEKMKTKEKAKINLLGSISLKGKMKDDIRDKGKSVKDKLLKSKIFLDKKLSKAQEDSISLEKLGYVKIQKISNSIYPFKFKFSFYYFFSSLMLFKLGQLSFRGAPLEIIVSSLLFSSLLSVFQKTKQNQ